MRMKRSEELRRWMIGEWRWGDWHWWHRVKVRFIGVAGDLGVDFRCLQ
jgi:hypothetical protein